MVGACGGRKGRFRWIVAVVVVLTGIGLCAPPSSLALAEGRSYEMVSPLYKGGYGANEIMGVAPDGKSVAFRSQGAFSGALYAGLNSYIARRGNYGWSTFSLEAPPTLIFPDGAEPADFSANLETSLIRGKPGPDLGGQSTTEAIFLLHGTEEPDEASDFEVFGMPLKAIGDAPITPGYEGGSPDFSHLLFTTIGSEPLLPEALEVKGTAHQLLYDLVRGGGANSLRLVGLNENKKLIDPYCPVLLGGSKNISNAIADDGDEIFFTTAANVSEEEHCGISRNPDGLYVRIGGERTLRLSPPPAGPNGEGPNAEFQGANEVGTCAFFIVNSNLYVARVGHAGETGGPCASRESAATSSEVSSLSQVSHDPNIGEAADVQGVVTISPDGSRVYFVARGVLSQGVDAEGHSPLTGADNLYVYETDSSSPHSTFVADLCSGSELSGEVRDPRCPPVSDPSEADASMWLGGGSVGDPQTAGDGRFLLFLTKAQLVANDTDTARDIYRYDATSGMLARVTEGEAGYHANGNDDNPSLEPKMPANPGLVAGAAGLVTRAINQAGTRIIFTTPEPLSREATNGLSNAYEWHMESGWSKAVVSLISSGDADEPVTDAVMSEDGRNVFFVTSEGLLSQDVDGAPDVYDARIEGGFPQPPAPAQPCSGDACQGGLTAPAPLLVPGSVSQTPGGNFATPEPAKIVKKKKTKAKHKPAKRRKRKTRKTRHGVARVGRVVTGRSGR